MFTFPHCLERFSRLSRILVFQLLSLMPFCSFTLARKSQDVNVPDFFSFFFPRSGETCSCPCFHVPHWINNYRSVTLFKQTYAQLPHELVVLFLIFIWYYPERVFLFPFVLIAEGGHGSGWNKTGFRDTSADGLRLELKSQYNEIWVCRLISTGGKLSKTFVTT